MLHKKGFTLLELLMVLAILSLLLTVSIPSLRQTLERHRGNAILRQLASSIAFARNSAIKSGLWVTLCPSQEGLQCDQPGDWLDGYIVFLDPERNRRMEKDDQLLLRVSQDIPDGSLSWRAFQNKPYLQFTPLGLIAGQSGSFTWCPADHNPALAGQLIINNVGRLRQAIDSDGDGISEDSQGKPLQCRPD